MPTITRANGYPSFKAHGLISEKFSALLDKNLYARTYLPKVTSSKYIGQIKAKGDKITIAREPKIETENYVAGKPYDIHTSLEQPFTMTVNRGLRWRQYYDENDTMRTHITGLDAATINAAANAIAKDMENEFIGEFPSFVPGYNRAAEATGTGAGKISGKYTLGSATKPVSLTFSNVIEYLMQFTSVLDETDVSNESGQRSILIPTIVGHYLRSSEKLLDASKIGGASSLKTQQLTTLPGIGTIYVSNLLPKLDNGAFPVICMTKEAVNFVVAAQKTRIINDLDLYDGTLLRGYAIYDWGVAREEGLALGYVTPSQSAISLVA
jgi:hypothetical protein